MHKTTFFIIKLWCIIEMLSSKLQNVTSTSFHDVRSGSRKSFIIRIVLAEGTKTCLVLGREIQESLVSSKLVTKRACPLKQWITNHTTTMNNGGGATGGEYGIIKTKS